jgi:peptidoglycan/LPS O-acetylase OafA/YrhL
MGFFLRNTFVALDTTRTILALAVAVGHLFYWNSIPTKFPQSFYLAVDFFFILSAFVITQSIIFDKSETLDTFVKNFAIRRVFRLFPLYLFLFIFCAEILVAKHWGDNDPFYYFAMSALLLQSMGFDTGAKHLFDKTTIGVGWSLSVELWVGLLFFPLIYLLRKNTSLMVLIGTLLAVFSMLVLVNFSPRQLSVHIEHVGGIFTLGAVRALHGFSLGAICFVLFNATKIRFSLVVGTLCEIGVIGLTVLLFGENGFNRQNDFVAPLLFSFIIYFIAMEQGLISKILSSSFFNLVRPLSYSVYLVHPFFIWMWQEFGIRIDTGRAIIYAVAILATSFLLYRWIEYPWMQKGRRFVGQKIEPSSLKAA